MLETKAAEKIVKHVPCAELVRFACSGTEANYNAIRVARAYTGKNMLVKFNGHYHGCLDQLIGGIVTDPANPIPVKGEIKEDPFTTMGNTKGRAARAFDDVFMIEWNELDTFTRLLERHGDVIGAVIMEPVMVNMSGCVPSPGYLEGVRELCTKHNVALIFDEVLTGFRMGLGGAQAAFGVTPDLATFAKAIGSGIPVSVFCGRRELMDTITRADVIAAGTYNGHPLAMAAVLATLEELERNDGEVYRSIEKHGNLLVDGLRALFRKHQVSMLLQGFPGAWTMHYTDQPVIHNHRESFGDGLIYVGQFSKLLGQRGVIVQSRFVTSAAHTEREVEETLRRADDALTELKASITS